MAPGGDEAQERGREGLRAQLGRGDVAAQVVDRRERQPARRGQRLGRLEPHEQGADEAGALGHGHQLGVVERGAGPRERVVDDGVDQLQVVAGGDLGDHAAEAVMDSLGGDDIGAHGAVGLDDRRAGVVAGRLDGQDQRPGSSTASGTSDRCPSSVAGVRHMMSASSPLSW